MANTFDVTPYAYPPKKWLLSLLGLPADASNDLYQRKFNAVVLPLIAGGSQAVWNKAVRDRQAATGETFEQAWAACRSSHRDLYESMQPASAAKRGTVNAGRP